MRGVLEKRKGRVINQVNTAAFNGHSGCQWLPAQSPASLGGFCAHLSLNSTPIAIQLALEVAPAYALPYVREGFQKKEKGGSLTRSTQVNTAGFNGHSGSQLKALLPWEDFAPT